jgi:hypothetical protein
MVEDGRMEVFLEDFHLDKDFNSNFIFPEQRHIMHACAFSLCQLPDSHAFGQNLITLALLVNMTSGGTSYVNM